MNDGTDLVVVLLFRGVYKALYDSNARWTIQLRPRRMRLFVSSEGEDRAWRGQIEGEVYLDWRLPA
jgi:hypothetical protein